MMTNDGTLKRMARRDMLILWEMLTLASPIMDQRTKEAAQVRLFGPGGIMEPPSYMGVPIREVDSLE